jgi:hypothetical protein
MRVFSFFFRDRKEGNQNEQNGVGGNVSWFMILIPFVCITALHAWCLLFSFFLTLATMYYYAHRRHLAAYSMTKF